MSCCTSGRAMSASTSECLVVSHVELAGHSARREQHRQRARRTGRCRRCLLGGCTVGGEQSRHDVALRAGAGAGIRRHAGTTQCRVDGRERETELLLRIRDPELQERRAFHDRSRARWIRLAGQLDDEPAIAGDLHDRLGRPELVDARAHDALGPTDRVGAVGDDAAGLIDLEREMHAAAQIEAHVDGHSPNGGVAHLSRARVVHALLDAAWHEREDARHDEGDDGDRPPLDGLHVDALFRRGGMRCAGLAASRMRAALGGDRRRYEWARLAARRLRRAWVERERAGGRSDRRRSPDDRPRRAHRGRPAWAGRDGRAPTARKASWVRAGR